MKDKIIRTPEVSKIIGLAIPTIQAKANPNSSSYDPGFPKAIRVGKRALGFNESEVKAWLDAQRVTGGVSDGNYTLTETWVRTLPIIGVLLVGRCRYQPIFSDCDLETPFRDYFFTDWLGMPPKPECEIELETTGGFITIPESLDHCIRTYCPMSGDRFYFHQLFMDKYKPCQLTKEAEAERLYWALRVLSEGKTDGWTGRDIEPKAPTEPQPNHPNRPWRHGPPIKLQ